MGRVDALWTKLSPPGRALAPLLPSEAGLPEDPVPAAEPGATGVGELGLVLGGGSRLGRLGM